jgi:hypothetical protein
VQVGRADLPDPVEDLVQVSSRFDLFHG